MFDSSYTRASKPEIEALTGLRAIAALWVVLYHLRAQLAVTFPAVWDLISLFFVTGYLGVDLFFILSGFIISYNYADRFAPFSWSTYRRFLWARLARLYPVHLFTLGLFAAWIAFAPAAGFSAPNPERFSEGSFLANILLVHGWTFPVPKTWNVPSWSISSEWAAYLLFPGIVALALVASRAKAHFLSLLAVFSAAGAIYMVTDLRGTMSYGMVRIAAEFFAGCVLYRLYRGGFGRGVNWDAVFLATAAAILLGGAVSHVIGANTLPWAPPLLCLVVYGLAFDGSILGRWLSRPTMLFWGRASYSLYMVHGVCLHVAYQLFPKQSLAEAAFWPRTLGLAMVMGAILASAAALYLWVEEPCRRGMRSWTVRRPARAKT